MTTDDDLLSQATHQERCSEMLLVKDCNSPVKYTLTATWADVCASLKISLPRKEHVHAYAHTHTHTHTHTHAHVYHTYGGPIQRFSRGAFSTLDSELPLVGVLGEGYKSGSGPLLLSYIVYALASQPVGAEKRIRSLTFGNVMVHSLHTCHAKP